MVATSTLAAYVSYSDLGTYVISGLNTQNTVLSVAGALLVGVMAGVVALALGLIHASRHADPPPRSRSSTHLGGQCGGWLMSNGMKT